MELYLKPTLLRRFNIRVDNRQHRGHRRERVHPARFRHPQWRLRRCKGPPFTIRMRLLSLRCAAS
jgi:hypothetical protein